MPNADRKSSRCARVSICFALAALDIAVFALASSLAFALDLDLASAFITVLHLAAAACYPFAGRAVHGSPSVRAAVVALDAFAASGRLEYLNRGLRLGARIALSVE